MAAPRHQQQQQQRYQPAGLVIICPFCPVSRAPAVTFASGRAALPAPLVAGQSVTQWSLVAGRPAGRH